MVQNFSVHDAQKLPSEHASGRQMMLFGTLVPCDPFSISRLRRTFRIPQQPTRMSRTPLSSRRDRRHSHRKRPPIPRSTFPVKWGRLACDLRRVEAHYRNRPVKQACITLTSVTLDWPARAIGISRCSRRKISRVHCHQVQQRAVAAQFERVDRQHRSSRRSDTFSSAR